MDRYDDEAMLRDIRHVAHHEGKSGGAAFGLLGLVLTFPATLVFLVALPVDLSNFVMIAISGCVSLFTGLLVTRWDVKRAERRWRAADARNSELREVSREAETRRKLEEARTSGAFDRWERR